MDKYNPLLSVLHIVLEKLEDIEEPGAQVRDCIYILDKLIVELESP